MPRQDENAVPQGNVLPARNENVPARSAPEAKNYVDVAKIPPRRLRREFLKKCHE